MALKITISSEMIEEVMREWEKEHPGKDALAMGPTEMADRMMAKIEASAEIVSEMPPHPSKQ